jgi:hypothetical protein
MLAAWRSVEPLARTTVHIAVDSLDFSTSARAWYIEF